MSFEVIQADAIEAMQGMADNSVSLICTDPPFYKVKKSAWDRQWKTPADFINWIGLLCEQWQRLLKPNGSIYVFASPEMAARVEVKMRDYFYVLNQIVWAKPEPTSEINYGAGKGGQINKESLRAYFPNTERIIFAEQYESDEVADKESGYTSQCEAAKRSIFGDYLKVEFDRAKVNNRQIALLFPSRTGGLTGCVSNWINGDNCPTSSQYLEIRKYLNSLNGSSYLIREYEELRQEYEALRRQYEGLRRQYEELRRPFNLSADVPYTDVWTFPTVQSYDGKHECEKPYSLIEHIVKVSSRKGDTVLDCFGGSFVCGDVCMAQGRDFIGIDNDAANCEAARARFSKVRGLQYQPSIPVRNEKPLPLFQR